MNSVPAPNQQPDWVNASLQHAWSRDASSNLNSDSTAIQPDPMDEEFETLRTTMRTLAPQFFEISSVVIPAIDEVIGSINYHEDIVCQKHHMTYRQTITFDINGTQETYCLGCIRDAIRERVAPINRTPEASDSTSNEPIQRFSRYDLIKSKDATGI